VSRRHCEFWCQGGSWFIKDVKSSSGTFLNHIRLSSPGTESRPFPVNDGDILQLGIDVKGGEEMIFRCVKIRVELNKGWQTGPTSFNVQSHKRLRELNNLSKPSASGSSQDCSICLGPIQPCQSLFVAPCSHTWHYKCIRVMINGPFWPHFTCPNCRTVADLEAELDEPLDGDWEDSSAIDTTPAKVPSPPEPKIDTSRQNRGPVITDETAHHISSEAGNSEPEHSGNSDGEIADTSDDSSSRSQRVNDVAEELGYINIRSDSSKGATTSQINNATVPPVDIIPRKPISGISPTTPRERSARTPSPTSLHPSSPDPVSHEGPMTPRNDVGPFVFDGSAGRASGIRLNTAAASANINATADSLTPQPQTSASSPHPA